MMLAPTARSGVLVGNPGREVIDEAGGVIGIDFILNVVLDEHRRVIGAVAGDGGHKAAAIAGLLARADVYVVSEFPDDVVRGMCMTPFATLGEALGTALARAGADARVLVVPHGNRVRAVPAV